MRTGCGLVSSLLGGITLWIVLFVLACALYAVLE
jgi:hypothetical protein